MNIQGKVAWVTGGVSGIGEGISRALYKEGAKLLLTDINVELGEEFVKEFGDDAIFVKADNGSWEELKAAAAMAVEKWGHLDLLLNSAGRGYPGVVLSDDQDKIEAAVKNFDEGVQALLGGSYYTSMIAANYMRKNEPDPETEERGSIILIGSMASDKIFLPFDERCAPLDTIRAVAYGSAKAGVLGLMREMAQPLAHHGIRINVIKPGYILTPLQNPVSEDGWHGKNDKTHLPMQLFPRTHGQKADVITSMAMEIFHNPFVDRTAIAVDGGIVG